MNGSENYSILDCDQGFHQISVAEEDRPKTAFIADNKLNKFKVMPFRLCNAPDTFQRLIDIVLRNLSWKHCLVYLDDIIIFAKDFYTHLERLEAVFSELAKAKLKLKPSKCKFFMTEVSYL